MRCFEHYWVRKGCLNQSQGMIKRTAETIRGVCRVPQKLINMLPFARNPVWLRWSGTRGNASIVAENRARRAARRVRGRKMLGVAAFCVGLIVCALPAFSALQD